MCCFHTNYSETRIIVELYNNVLQINDKILESCHHFLCNHITKSATVINYSIIQQCINKITAVHREGLLCRVKEAAKIKASIPCQLKQNLLPFSDEQFKQDRGKHRPKGLSFHTLCKIHCLNIGSV